MSVHVCHAVDCETPVALSSLMCAMHWSRLPPSLRDTVWQAYRKGQEITKDPSTEYLEAARTAIEYIKHEEGK